MKTNPTIKRPVLRYHGGKFLLAPWIISHFPPHRIYVELFGGAGSVLMRKERSYAEVYNDKWDTVVNVFSILRDPEQATELERLLSLTPFSRTEFNACGETELENIADPIEKARRTIFRSFAGFGSAATNARFATGFRANSNKSGTTPAHDWANFSSHILTFVERLRGVVIENRDYKDILRQQDSAETLFYADPPYVHSTRNMQRGNAAYVFEMDDSQQVELAQQLNSIKGMAVVSGYPSPLYDEIYRGWEKIEREALADGARKRTEVLYLNEQASIKLMLS